MRITSIITLPNLMSKKPVGGGIDVVVRDLESGDASAPLEPKTLDDVTIAAARKTRKFTIRVVTASSDGGAGVALKSRSNSKSPAKASLPP